jgi:hypothetical protein
MAITNQDPLILQRHRNVLDRIFIVIRHKSVVAPLTLVDDLFRSSQDTDLVREWLALRLDFS